MGKLRTADCVPVEPFRSWLNERYAKYVQDLGGGEVNQSGNEAARGMGPAQRVCIDIGWGSKETATRKLYRYRLGITETAIKRDKKIVKKIRRDAIGFDRKTVEDALHHAGEDFYQMYAEYWLPRIGTRGRPLEVLRYILGMSVLAGHLVDRDEPLQPEAWCPGCRCHVLVVDEDHGPECVWCSWRISEGHLNKRATERREASAA